VQSAVVEASSEAQVQQSAMNASRLSSAIFLRWSTGERIFEMSMAYSVLQLWCRRDCAAYGDSVATNVPCGADRRFFALKPGAQVRLCGLLRRVMQHATACCPVVALICCIAATTIAAASSARAQAPTEETAIDAFIVARGWLDRDALPPLDAPDSAAALPDTKAVSVILRANGRVVGRGDDATGDTSMLRRATGRAIAEALGDATVRATRADLDDRVTARLAIEIELAGATKPLLGRTIAEAATRIVPGTAGIAVLRGDEVFRAFPSRLLASDSADRPDATITMLMRSAGLPAKELREFATTERVSLGKFDTVRIRQATAQAPPSIVTRAGRLIALDEVTHGFAGGFTRTLATQLAARLGGNVVVRDGSAEDVAAPHERAALLGTYNPTADVYDPPLASAADEAFAALALAWASRSEALPAPARTAAAAQAAKLVTKLAAEIARGNEAGAESKSGNDGTTQKSAADDVRAQRDAAVAAMTLHAARLAADSEPAPLLAPLTDRVRNSARAFVEGEATEFTPLSIEIAASSIAALTAPGASEEDALLASRLLDRLLRATADQRGRLADVALPLALALAAATLPAQSREALREVLDEIARVAENLQIGLGPTPDGTPADLAGGIALPSSRLLVADAQCLRLAAAVAVLRSQKPRAEAAVDERPPSETPPASTSAAPREATSAAPSAASPEPNPATTPEPQPIVIIGFVRFLAQHMANEPWTDGFRQPDAVRGLVRASLATDDCPPAATAAGLFLSIAAAESLDRGG
jgi:hypothetical protein